ncbi:MAG: regulatory protein RecX [Acidobacteria bacterium]|nr:regulatory protein RecX [Acidobacteriota bacterium]MBV9474898.1 regulatory protein RecX [Acidobacteriota bacterium]
MPEDTVEACHLAALRILQYRFNSEGELRRKLRAKKFGRDVIDATIEKLRAERWLDDERFAGAFVRTQALKKVGRNRIRRALEAAGVDAGLAASAVAEHVDEEREREALASVAARRARQLVRRHGEEYLRTAEGRNKLTIYLLNQGYDAGLIAQALKEIQVADRQPDS